jgi:hypothetical protein
MTKVLTFKVCIEGLEDKIWRKIEITDRRTVADLAYTILATFDSLAYHLYNIEYKNKVYDSWVCVEDGVYDEEPINATITKLSTLNLKESDTLKMEYDYGSTTSFIITYLGEIEFKKGNGMHYPCVIEGAGYGMIDDITDEELKEIVEDIDRKGKSDYYSLYMDGRHSYIYDYRVFNLRDTNLLISRYFLKIKHGYEVGE